MFIDVNDPRNEETLKRLRFAKNEFLQKILSDDSKNQLADITPFRHLLLQRRSTHHNFQQLVPFLENEVIDPKIQDFYLSELEQIF